MYSDYNRFQLFCPFNAHIQSNTLFFSLKLYFPRTICVEGGQNQDVNFQFKIKAFIGGLNFLLKATFFESP